MEHVLLVEDHTAFRQTLALVLDGEPGYEVIAQVGTVAGARDICDELKGEVDLGIFDLSLPDGEGIELIEELREANPEFRALILTGSLDRAAFGRAVEAGAAGVLHKTADLYDILDAVRRLVAGEALLSAAEKAELLDLANNAREQERKAKTISQRLTPREREVLQALADGLNNKEIAQSLHISLDTQRTHVFNILNKTGAHSQLQALIFAVRHGLVELR